MENKIDTIYIDLDGCVFNTIKAITDMYNEDFRNRSKFKWIDWRDVKTWDFKELALAPPKYIEDYFNEKRFFDIVEFMPNFDVAVEILNKKLHVKFCSMGDAPNLQYKKELIKKNFPFADFIGVDIKSYKDKAHVDMSGAIFIDDIKENLETSNAAIKILFGNDYDWNAGWDQCRCYDWIDVLRFIISLIKGGEIIDKTM